MAGIDVAVPHAAHRGSFHVEGEVTRQSVLTAPVLSDELLTRQPAGQVGVPELRGQVPAVDQRPVQIRSVIDPPRS
ncbi:hypothetical protein RLL24_05205, partial [Streptococcus pneumoniae]|nr:hypothetical protein [Streptococcus pneumoniae]